LRGGAFKPRTGPHSFQGLGYQGLEYLAEAGQATGLPIVTEVMRIDQLERVAATADCLQVGARNMQNFDLLKEVGRVGKPVLLKRGMSATVEEFLAAAEYIVLEGNPRVILCERGIRTFEQALRNTLDLGVVPHLRQITHLPVIVDPSHALGRRDLVLPMAKAAILVGAAGVMVEVHPDPAHALCDGPQSLDPAALAQLMRELPSVVALRA
jgi:3-deoxy-7-phosphoheptulonate synthase